MKNSSRHAIWSGLLPTMRNALMLFILTICFAQVRVQAQSSHRRTHASPAAFSEHGYSDDINPCLALLSDGLRDEYSTGTHVSLFSDSKSYFSSDQFVQDYHSNKWNGAISVVIDDVPIGLSAGSSDAALYTFQNKIRRASSVVISYATYSTLSRSTLNVELANKFNECIEINQRFGLSVQMTGEDIIAFTVRYHALSSGDPHPYIKSVEVRGIQDDDRSQIINHTLAKDNLVEDEVSFTARRKGHEEVLIVVNTTNGLSIVKRLASNDESASMEMPVGTIIISMLDFESFSKATKNNAAVPSGLWSPTKSKWAPCDGRSVVGSKYQTTWAGAIGLNVPDMRGVFLRGLNQFDPQEPTRVSTAQANPEIKNRGDFQEDQFKIHSHTFEHFDNHIITDFSNDKDQRKASLGGSNTISTSGVGDPNETRPKNRSVFYYIRIN